MVCRYQLDFEKAAAHNEQLRANLGKVVDDLNPLRVLALFNAIPDAVCTLAGGWAVLVCWR